MKTKIITLLFVSFIYCISASAQSTTNTTDPVGSWKFEAPSAPEGYTSGTIVVSMAEKKYNTTMSFTGSEYKLNGENVKVEKNILSFTVYIEGEGINTTLKIENAKKMSGKAVYSGGEVPLSLAKSTAAK